MVRALICMALVFLLAGAAAAADETLVYRLDEVTGDYPVILPSGNPSFDRTQTIIYHGPAARVEAIRVIVSGEAEAGLVECWMDPEGADTSWVGMEVSHSISRADVYERWWGYDEATGGGFVMTNELHPSSSFFDTMTDGDTFEFSQRLAPFGLVGMCRFIAPLPWQEGRIDSAVLEIDVTYTISTEPTTWGRIKALYH
jgi:hypothetical protein